MLINSKNKPTGTSWSAKSAPEVLQWNLRTDQLNNSLTEIDLEIKLIAKLNMSQVCSYCKQEKPRGVQAKETKRWWDCNSNTVSYVKPPTLKRNLRTWKESPKWPAALTMMFKKQVMELGLFSPTKRQPRDDLKVTEAESALQNQWRQTPLSITSNSLGGSDWTLKKAASRVVWCHTQRW